MPRVSDESDAIDRALDEREKLRADLRDAREEVARLRAAESNLACICDVVNSWAREENYPETSDYLGECAIRDHINGLWGHVNQRHFARLDKLQAQLAAALDKRDAALGVLRALEDAILYHLQSNEEWENGRRVRYACSGGTGEVLHAAYKAAMSPEVAALLAGRQP